MMIWLLLIDWGGSAAVAHPSEEVRHYREVTGSSVKNVKWCLEKGDEYKLSSTTSHEQHVTTVGTDYDTSRWRVRAHAGNTDFSAERNGNTIFLRGLFKGKALEKTLPIDGAPWYQATSLSLRHLAASSSDQQVFWTIRYDTLNAHKVKAIKKGIETIESADGDKAMLRIRLTLTGPLAFFWQSNYWFSLPECVFYRFEGPSGPPGSPMTIITRVGS
jgi:hypothetical protein